MDIFIAAALMVVLVMAFFWYRNTVRITREYCRRTNVRKPLIYIAHPFGGRDENFILAKKYIMALQECHRDKAFISPVISYGYCYHAHTYERGINMCLDLLAKCDELWILGDDGESKGVKIERAWAQEHGVKIREFKSQLDAVEGKEII